MTGTADGKDWQAGQESWRCQHGRYNYGGPLTVLVGLGAGKAKFTSGAFCSFADGIRVFLGGGHHTEWVSTFPFMTFKELAPDTTPEKGAQMATGDRDVVVGNDVWISKDVTLLGGATIGDGAVIGFGAVVRGAVPPYAIVSGNPASVVRYRFSTDKIAALRRIAWWDWPLARIQAAVPWLVSNRIEEFIEKAERGEL